MWTSRIPGKPRACLARRDDRHALTASRDAHDAAHRSTKAWRVRRGSVSEDDGGPAITTTTRRERFDAAGTRANRVAPSGRDGRPGFAACGTVAVGPTWIATTAGPTVGTGMPNERRSIPLEPDSCPVPTPPRA